MTFWTPPLGGIDRTHLYSSPVPVNVALLPRLKELPPLFFFWILLGHGRLEYRVGIDEDYGKEQPEFESQLCHLLTTGL